MASSTSRSRPEAISLFLHCRKEIHLRRQSIMISASLTRRKFASAFAPLLSGLGLSAALGKAAMAKKSAAQQPEVRKLNDEGKPADGTQFITPIDEHHG